MSYPIKGKNFINASSGFDVIGDILETLRFHGTVFLHSELAAPWGLSLGKIKAPRLHIMLSGHCYMGMEDEQPSRINDMEIMMLPNGDSHWIVDEPNRKLTPVKEAGEACELGTPLFQQGKITHKVICGMVQFDEETVHPILDSLPKSILFSRLKPTEPVWIIG
ncbi:MAG: cupin domain-containing protein [gamma proteobacterium symbiont of Lucinoma myriamae]|nr:cupin domain-containing protein [gamma proteobacterium symbiont of Lucinoma myriamae]